jgi:hypothetical protein
MACDLNHGIALSQLRLVVKDGERLIACHEYSRKTEAKTSAGTTTLNRAVMSTTFRRETASVSTVCRVVLVGSTVVAAP